MVIQIQQAALQRFCSNWRQREHRLRKDALVYNGNGVAGCQFQRCFGAFSLFNNQRGFTTTPWAIPHCLKIFTALQTRLGDLALSNNDSNRKCTLKRNTGCGGEAL